MRNPLKALVGTPQEHEKEKKEHEVVEAPEFDLTLYAKRAAVVIPVLVAAVVGIFEARDVPITEAIWIGILALVAIVLLGASFVMAADLLARAYVTGSGAGAKGETGKGSAAKPEAEMQIVALPRGTTVWVEGSDEPRPALAVGTRGEEAVSYLVAGGAAIERASRRPAIDGSPQWYPAEKIRATKPAKWP